ILLSADEVITGFGRLGYWFGSERYDIRPDIVCSAKGLSSSHAAIGAVIATDRVMEPFLEGSSMYTHGITFGGHPVQCAIALKNIEIMKRERISERVRGNEAAFRSTLEQLLALPIAGDVRGAGRRSEARLFSGAECDRRAAAEPEPEPVPERAPGGGRLAPPVAKDEAPATAQVPRQGLAGLCPGALTRRVGVDHDQPEPRL